MSRNRTQADQETSHDRTQTLQQAGRRRPWLAQGQAPFLLRQLLRSRQYGPRRACASGTTTRSRPTPAFPPHPHANMEIITYVREGAITHQDSLGNEGRTEAGDVQVMSAGSGIRHSEYNLEPQPTKIFQIWIEPTRRAARRPGAPSRSRRRTAPASSSPSPAASRMTRTRCRSAPTRACSARR